MANKNIIHIEHNKDLGGIFVNSEIHEEDKVREIMCMLTLTMCAVIKENKIDKHVILRFLDREIEKFIGSYESVTITNHSISAKEAFLAMAKNMTDEK